MRQCLATKASSRASLRLALRRKAARAMVRYMAPVSRKSKPSRSATLRATVDLPVPAGPSIVTIMRGILRWPAPIQKTFRFSSTLGDFPGVIWVGPAGEAILANKAVLLVEGVGVLGAEELERDLGGGVGDEDLDEPLAKGFAAVVGVND